MFNPSQFQPLLPYFDMTLAGITHVFDPPNTPTSFELKLSTKEMSSVAFGFWDVTGAKVEPLLWKARDPKSGVSAGTFKFGYKGNANIDSPEYAFQGDGWKPTFRGSHYSLLVRGSMSVDCKISSNQVSGTILECIQKFANFYNTTVIIDPPFGVDHMQEVASNSRTTAKQEMKFGKLASESDWRTLIRILYYARDQDGKAGYRPYWTTDGNGKVLLKIVKPSNNKTDYTFTIQDPDGPVVTWEPDINFSGIFAAADTHFNGHQRSTGYTQKFSLNQQVTQPYVERFGYDAYQLVNASPDSGGPPDDLIHICAEGMDKKVATNAIRSRHQSTASPFAGINPSLVHHAHDWMQLNNAVLTIPGDPSLEAGKVAEILCYLPINYDNPDVRQLHYSSGYYNVYEVIHRIVAGQYITILSMERSALPFIPESGGSSQGASK